MSELPVRRLPRAGLEAGPDRRQLPSAPQAAGVCFKGLGRLSLSSEMLPGAPAAAQRSGAF